MPITVPVVPRAPATADATAGSRRLPDAATGFASAFDANRQIQEADIGWNGWEILIETLGWQEFAPLVEAACADGRLDTGMSDLNLFRSGLAEAMALAPDDHSRVDELQCGPIGNVLMAASQGAPELAEWVDEDAFGDRIGQDDADDGWAMPPSQEQRIDPMRHVGRNDPCPCGSGKNYKKCCLVVA